METVVAIGLILIGLSGAWDCVRDDNWFFNFWRIRRVVAWIGRPAARIVYFVAGLAFVLYGVGLLAGWFALPALD